MFENNFKEQGQSYKKLCLLYPFLPTYIPPTQHILWHFLEINIHFWSCCYKKNHGFSFYAATYFPAYLPIPKYRIGVLQILNLKNDPSLENVVNFFSEQGNMTPSSPLPPPPPPHEKATLSHSGLVVRGSKYGVWIFSL